MTALSAMLNLDNLPRIRCLNLGYPSFLANSKQYAFPVARTIRCWGSWVGLAVLLGMGGCSKLLQLPVPKQVSEAELKFQVTPTAPGTYAIAGTTNLPDQSQVRVAAIRYLYPANRASRDLNPKPTYSILAYQTAAVNQGKWEVSLNLWKTAQDGRYQETWQLDQPKLKMALEPESKVVFLATYVVDNRSNQLLKLDQQLREQGKTLENGVLLTTVDNRRYLQSTQKVAIALPTGKTTPPPIQPEDVNGGWGNRYLMPGEPPNPIRLEFPENRKTNALPSPVEFMK
ncbi:MAG: hypothetical protein K6T90_18765 [Leptolyngbyaceae cyanobacterium HOT.MB2.61]|nr:hypothetical protein [Leptolyngbyaceae cyanobacterium HOT.MB2.61]